VTKITLWGTRGSVASPGAYTARYGGNTSCVEIRDDAGNLVILDAGSGIRPLGRTVPNDAERIDLLLTHLHLDHILGLGFFMPMQNPRAEVHIWGPTSTTMSLEKRLKRYLSPPYFPLFMNELACKLVLHELASAEFDLASIHVMSEPICHPGLTLGFRLTTASGKTIVYMPDHEPALGAVDFPSRPDWTSGFAIAEGADVLIHDTQYTHHEYADRIGWGHSAIEHTVAFAEMAGVKQLVSFHYDPAHDDATIDRNLAPTLERKNLPFVFTPGTEGSTLDIG